MKFMRMKFAGKSICLTMTIKQGLNNILSLLFLIKRCLTMTIKQGLEAIGFSFNLCQIYFTLFELLIMKFMCDVS